MRKSSRKLPISCQATNDPVNNPGRVQREPAAWLGGTRHKGGVDPAPGPCVERGNLSPRCEGRNPRGRPPRMRSPMRGTGAERPVRAMKSGKLDGAKGVASSSVSRRSTACAGGAVEPREAVQSRLDDGSCMSGDVHVQFCERPGVRFPRGDSPRHPVSGTGG